MPNSEAGLNLLLYPFFNCLDLTCETPFCQCYVRMFVWCPFGKSCYATLCCVQASTSLYIPKSPDGAAEFALTVSVCGADLPVLTGALVRR